MKQSKIGAKMQCVSFSLDNWETVFYICHSVRHLSRAGKEVSTGTFLWHEIFQESSLCVLKQNRIISSTCLYCTNQKTAEKWAHDKSVHLLYIVTSQFMKQSWWLQQEMETREQTFLDILTLSSKQLTENQGNDVQNIMWTAETIQCVKEPVSQVYRSEFDP